MLLLALVLLLLLTLLLVALLLVLILVPPTSAEDLRSNVKAKRSRSALMSRPAPEGEAQREEEDRAAT